MKTNQDMTINNPTKKYHHTNTCVYSCQYHVIFTPKYRKTLLTNNIDNELKQLILAKQNEYHYTILAMEIMPDHVHLLLDTDPTTTNINTIISKIKGYTSHELRQNHPNLQKYPSLWTRSRFISTCGTISLETVKQYINNQKENAYKKQQRYNKTAKQKRLDKSNQNG